MITEQMKAAARGWVVRLSGDGSSDARAQFESWLAEDAAHPSAYRSAARVWDAVGELRHLAPLALVSPRASWPARALRALRGAGEALSPSLYRARFAAVAAGLVAIVGVTALVAHLNGRWTSDDGRHATAVAEIRDVALPDGSRVTLDARSSIETRFATGERRIVLRQGAAVFSVAKDAARPFIVVADGVLVRAVGTQFEVHRGASRVRVAVIEGSVDVADIAPTDRATSTPPRGAARGAKRLTAGQQLTTIAHAEVKFARVQALDVSQAGSWRSGTLRYSDASLAEVVADVNRYHAEPILLGVPELAALRVTTSFGTHQVEQLLESLPGVLPVRLDRSTPGRVVLLPAP